MSTAEKVVYLLLAALVAFLVMSLASREKIRRQNPPRVQPRTITRAKT